MSDESVSKVTQYVPEHPRRMLASAIGAEDGQCAYIHAGIEERCTNDAVAHTFYDFEGERQRVEMCEDHCPVDLDDAAPLVTDGGQDVEKVCHWRSWP